jgi:Flp pilus assembly protein CpaB
MTTTRIRAAMIAATLVSASLIALTACKKAETPAPAATAAPAAETAPTSAPAPAVSVTDLSVGKALGPDKKVQSPVDTFSPKDTIFASVSTDGSAPSSVIAVKWTYGADGQTVKEDTRTINPTGPAVTEFSIQKAGGWPKGDYKIEVTVDGKPGPSKTFKVQ